MYIVKGLCVFITEQTPYFRWKGIETVRSKTCGTGVGEREESRKKREVREGREQGGKKERREKESKIFILCVCLFL